MKICAQKYITFTISYYNYIKLTKNFTAKYENTYELE